MGYFVFDDLTGKVFGDWTVVKRVKNNKHNQIMYLCVCTCGNERNITGAHLKHGRSKGCRSCVSKNPRSHGLSKHPLYKLYYSIKNRCFNENDQSYQKWYGIRGISMCDEWENDFLSFYNWAIESGWKEGLTIERTDVNGNYCPNNCKWATQIEQANNKRNNLLVTINGEVKTLSQWSRETGIHKKTLKYRLEQNWTDEKLLSKPRATGR